MNRILYVCAVVAVIVVAYVGSYYALVVREPEGLSRLTPRYRYFDFCQETDEAAESFFSLWHNFDKSIRPDYWGVNWPGNRK
jgi:hypothetical protein